MRSKLGDQQRIYHIRDAIAHIQNFTADVDYDEYLANFQLRLALVKLFEIIGEASAMLSDELIQEISEVEWRTLKAVRNILVHEYFGISYDILWNSIQRDVPTLKMKIDHIIATKFPEDLASPREES